MGNFESGFVKDWLLKVAGIEGCWHRKQIIHHESWQSNSDAIVRDGKTQYSKVKLSLMRTSLLTALQQYCWMFLVLRKKVLDVPGTILILEKMPSWSVFPRLLLRRARTLNSIIIFRNKRDISFLSLIGIIKQLSGDAANTENNDRLTLNYSITKEWGVIAASSLKSVSPLLARTSMQTPLTPLLVEGLPFWWSLKSVSAVLARTSMQIPLIPLKEEAYLLVEGLTFWQRRRGMNNRLWCVLVWEKGATSLKKSFEGRDTADGWCVSLVSCDFEFWIVE